jgi:hypothetical protein
MPRKTRSLFKVRKPKVCLTTKGVRITRPSARIVGNSGVDICSKGVSFSSKANSKQQAPGEDDQPAYSLSWMDKEAFYLFLFLPRCCEAF